MALLLMSACRNDAREVAIDDVPPAAQAGATGNGASTGTVTEDCGTNAGRHLNADNIVSAPGKPFGAHHTHEYVGNTSTDHASTDDSLAAATTTCPDDDRSTYYWPVLRLTARTGPDHHAPGGGEHGNTGEVLPPGRVGITFTGNPASHVVPMPRFLRLITGDPSARTTGQSTAKWSCTGFEDRRTGRYPVCPADSDVVRIFEFPSCWDGRNTDSPSHRAHLVFPGADGVCPPRTFPVPKLTVRVVYDVPEGEPFAVDSFPDQDRDPRTDHSMAVNVMTDDGMRRVAECLNSGRTCP
ncbi:hypothetical protein GCM10022243_17710 [Saccharothrix violaceirubra]